MEEKTGSGGCTCGYKPDSLRNPAYLKPGSVVDSRYIVGDLLRHNGEGGVYIGYDNDLQKKVWIREYFPHSLATRDRATGVVLPREGFGAQYKALHSDFLDVCATVKRLAEGGGAVVPIEHVVSENNTSYAVYRYLPLVSLETYIAGKDGWLEPAKALKLFNPLFNTLQSLHDMGGRIHRGISPYTILTDERGRLYLGDFLVASARSGGSELDAELYNGYSAPEQYAANRWQGTYTDVYALAAVLYRVISGNVPPKSTLINAQRPLASLVGIVPDMPVSISDAIEDAMQISSEHRTQTIMTFISALHQPAGGGHGHTAVYDRGAVTQDPDDDYDDYYDRERKPATFKFLAFALLLTVGALIGFMYLLVSTLMPGMFEPQTGPSGPGGTSPPTNVSVVTPPTDPPPADPGPAPDPTTPRFVGRLLTAVESVSDYNERFTFDIREQFNSTFPEGTIFDQNPPPDTPDRDVVVLYVSQGPPRIEMPDLVGMDIFEAMEILFDLGTEHSLHLPMVSSEIHSLQFEGGQIVWTDPPAGTDFFPERGRPIQVFTAIGTAQSEDVTPPEPHIPDPPALPPGSIPLPPHLLG